MKFVDSHCHLDIEPLAGEFEAAIERATKADVVMMINVGASMRGSKRSVELANLYPNIWASVGLHPHDAETILDMESTIEELRILAKNDKVVALGEIGLDYFDFETRGEVSQKIKDDQKKLFEAQLDLAVELKKPVIIHTRDAWSDTLSILKNFKLKNENWSEAMGVVHCFTGGPEEVKPFLDLGFYIGYTGFITFEQSKFDLIREAVKATPLNRILTETDAPFLAPEPHRGKTNEPAYVSEVAKKIAEIKGVNIEEVALCSEKNTKKVFNI
jgi:TatD DNase family protein